MPSNRATLVLDLRGRSWIVTDSEGLWGSVRALDEHDARKFLDGEVADGSLHHDYQIRLED